MFGNERSVGEYNHPVLHVSLNDALAYCEWLSKKSDKIFRLPTEAEWEYAFHAGTTTSFNTGENLTTEQANYNGNFPYENNLKEPYRKNTVAVDSFAPNAWGLYIMHGYIYEWRINSEGLSRELIHFIAEYVRSARRFYSTSDSRFCGFGFRLVFVP